MSIESNNSSGVTLALRENTHQPICKFNQSGFCKFGYTCRKMLLATWKLKQTFKVEQLEEEVNVLKSEIQTLKHNLINSENEILRKAVEELKIVVISNKQQIEALQNFVNEDKVKISADICGFETWSAGIAASIGNIETWSAGVNDNLEFHDLHIKTYCTKNNICHICCHEARSSTPPASFSNLISEFAYSGCKFFFHMALRLKDPEIFSHFYRSHFEIWNLKRITICLYNYNGKHLYMITKVSIFSFWKVGIIMSWI